MQDLQSAERKAHPEAFVKEEGKVDDPVDVELQVALAVRVQVVGRDEDLERLGGETNKKCNVGEEVVERLALGGLALGPCYPTR